MKITKTEKTIMVLEGLAILAGMVCSLYYGAFDFRSLGIAIVSIASVIGLGIAICVMTYQARHKIMAFIGGTIALCIGIAVTGTIIGLVVAVALFVMQAVR